MKLLTATFLASASAKTVRVNDFRRNFGGDFFENLVGAQERGYNYGNEDALMGLSAMAVFLDESRIMSRSDQFEMEIQDFLDNFTNYGCYCWIVGPMRGVIGGGQTVDEIDNLCGQLYKCYKCLNLDHGSSPNLFEYSVNFNVDAETGERSLDCQAGPNVDACKCDVMFAEKLAKVNAQCEADQLAGVADSEFCVNEKYRTLNGGGSFDPTDNSEAGCLKVNMEGHNAKDQCCGTYPDRLPFDSMSRECCEFTESDGDEVFFSKKIVPFGTCDARGGTVVN